MRHEAQGTRGNPQRSDRGEKPPLPAETLDSSSAYGALDEEASGRGAWKRQLKPLLRLVIVAIAALGLIAGFAFGELGQPERSAAIWTAATLPVLSVLLVEIVLSLRRGDFGLDIVAAISMSAGLVFGQELAAVIVALMYAGGQFLENYAEGRAGQAITALLARAPRSALRYRENGLESVPIDTIRPRDTLLIGHGAIVPTDGTVAHGRALVDESAMTGESMPVAHPLGAAVMSGSVNVAEPFDLHVTRPAAASTYAGIVRLVEGARRSKAPMGRLADRYAIAFLAATLLLSGGAWLWTGDPIRGLAVLVVATPCPLILAVPVAIVSGMSRIAKLGVLVKSAHALEKLTRIKVLVIDKTGTLTYGQARLVDIRPAPGFEAAEILRLGASLDQVSNHVIATAVVRAARARGLDLSAPTAVSENAGAGLTGSVEGRPVVIGGQGYVQRQLGGTPDETSDPPDPGAVTVAVGIDRRFAGTLVLADIARMDASEVLQRMRSHGISRIVVATGDRREVAERVIEGYGVDALHADLEPEDKVNLVKHERDHGPVMMIGDGINDAPALAAADVGIAMGTAGLAASAAAADAVLLVDRLGRVLDAILAARRARRIAVQSIIVGLGLSGGGMLAAAFGYLTPVQGALFQEVIDLAVVLNALRALGGYAPQAEDAPKTLDMSSSETSAKVG